MTREKLAEMLEIIDREPHYSQVDSDLWNLVGQLKNKNGPVQMRDFLGPMGRDLVPVLNVLLEG